MALMAGACSGSPTATPPAVINTPPTIESLSIDTRAEADTSMPITAVVKDVESPIDKLVYTWSASPQTGAFGGTTLFVGNQAINHWRPPKGQKTPDLYTITLTVSESYTSAGQAKQNVVSASTAVHYNDSDAEVKALGYDFLVLKFGNFSVTGPQAVSNFSDSCSGKAQESSEIDANRQNFHILSASFPSPVATFNSDLTQGTVEGACRFEDIPNSGPNAGRREFVNGTCQLTTIYQNFRWYLCESHFNPPYDTELASLKGRVPGQIRLR